MPVRSTGAPKIQAQPATDAGPSFGIWSPITASGNITVPSILPGSTIPLSVNATNLPLFDFYSFDLEFNPSVIQLVSVTLRGTVFYPNIKYQSLFNYTFVPGVLHVVVQGNTPALGNGILLNTNFQVLIPSISNLEVANSVLALQGTLISHNETNGCFNNRPSQSPVANFTLDSSPGYQDTSSYMVGKIAVGIILTNGPYYNWTDDQVNQTISGIKAAMSFWASQDPGANLTFYYDTHLRVPVSVEPINMQLAQDTLWIPQVMTELGHPGDAISATRAYDNAIRKANDTNWAFTIFVVDDDPNVRQGRFTDFQYADAYIGGPFETMSRFSSWAYNSAQYFTAVPAHETGHIFGATDEYLPYTSYSGYLMTPNAPGAFGIMNRNTLSVSVSTEAQIGHVDCNGNGIPDVQETRPAVKVSAPSTVMMGQVATVSGEAMATPYPAGFGLRSITIGTISTVQYSVNQGAWSNAALTGESFNNTLQDFAFNLAGLSGGTSTVQVRAVNSVGVSSQSTSFLITVISEIGTASFLRWKATVEYHNLKLARVSEQIFKADVAVANGSLYVYVKFQLTSDNGANYTVLAPVDRIGAGNNATLLVSWTPPTVQTRYSVTATIYSSPGAPPIGSPFWKAGQSTRFTFQVTTSKPLPLFLTIV